MPDKQRNSKNVFAGFGESFRVLARKASGILGSAWAFSIALLVIVVWACTGPIFHYSDTW